VTIAAELRGLGLKAGDRVVVHSSLRAVGRAAGGPEAVVDAFLDVLGPGGTLMVPTFTYTTTRFQPALEPARTGALAEAVRRRDDAVRSLHPTHSVAVLGPEAQALCAGHENLAATDRGTPLDRLADAGGLVLLLGVGHIANTTVHVGEFRAGMSYLVLMPRSDWPRAHQIIGADGSERRVAYDRYPGCSRAFGVVEHGLRERGAIRDGRVGRAESQLMPGAAVLDETSALLDRDPCALLCSDPRPDHRCAPARALETRRPADAH
jgi:aminoglycoside 3-N-acetyltransferase